MLFRLEKPSVQIGEPVLQVEGLTGGRLHGVDLEVRAGEIVGVAGVEGNGQRELAEALARASKPAGVGHASSSAGTTSPGWSGGSRSATPGVGFVPEDRHEQGLVLDMSIWENAILGRQDDPRFSSRVGFLAIGRIKQLAAELVKRFDVRARSIDVTAATLSGGNQQKLILARELETDPKLLVAAQPTRGLDVGAIEFVWRQILEQKAEGRAVLLISAELDEIYALSDRIVTLYEGQDHGRVPARRAARGGRRRDARRPNERRRRDGEGLGRGWPRAPPTPAPSGSTRRGPAARAGRRARRALFVGGLIILGYGESPITVYSTILKFAFQDANGFGYDARHRDAADLLRARGGGVLQGRRCSTSGSRASTWSAMVTASWAALNLHFLPGPLLMWGALVFAMLGGMAWGMIPAILKVKTGAHEVVTTIMLNGIAVSLLGWALNGPLKYRHSRWPVQRRPSDRHFAAERPGARPRPRVRDPGVRAPVVAAAHRAGRGRRRVVRDPADAPGLRVPSRGIHAGRRACGWDLGRRRPDQGCS